MLVLYTVPPLAYRFAGYITTRSQWLLPSCMRLLLTTVWLDFVISQWCNSLDLTLGAFTGRDQPQYWTRSGLLVAQDVFAACTTPTNSLLSKIASCLMAVEIAEQIDPDISLGS